LHPLKSAIGQAIAEKGEPNPSDLAEVNVMALMAAKGANRVEYVRRAVSRTPDLHTWWMDELIEVEVTKAAQKQAHIERSDLASQIAKNLLDLGRSSDLIVHFAEVLSEDEVTKLMKAANIIMPGNVVESQSQWKLIAESPNRNVGTLWVGGMWDEAPPWWPPGLIKSCVFMQTVDACGATSSSPQTRVNFGVPLTGYVNPVQKKGR
jgi:hypothetical protein